MTNEQSQQTEIQNRLNYRSQKYCEKLIDEINLMDKPILKEIIYIKISQAMVIGFEMGSSFASNKRKPVCCIKNGIILKIYGSIADAGKELKIFPNNITRVLTQYGERKCKMAKGYNWKYFELFDFVGKRINI